MSIIYIYHHSDAVIATLIAGSVEHYLVTLKCTFSKFCLRQGLFCGCTLKIVCCAIYFDSLPVCVSRLASLMKECARGYPYPLLNAMATVELLRASNTQCLLE